MSLTVPTSYSQIATDCISGEHFQMFKLIDATPLSIDPIGIAGNPLRVLPTDYVQAVSGTVAANQRGAWTFTGSVTATPPAGYVQPVTGSVLMAQTGPLTVTGSVAASQTGAWIVTGSVGASQQGTWTVNASISGTVPITGNVGQSGQWTISGSVGASQQGQWTVTASLPGVLPVSGNVGASQVGNWTVGASISGVIPVSGNIGASQVGAWTVGASVTGLLSITGSVGASQLGAPWTVTGSQTVTGSVNANVSGSVSVTGSINASAYGDAANDAADIGNPVKFGGYASDSVNPTRVGSGDRVNAWFDQTGRQVTQPFGPRATRTQQYTTLNTTNQTTILSAAAAGIFQDLITVIVDNTSPLGTRVDFRDTSASAVLFSISAPSSGAGGPRTIFLVPTLPINQGTAALPWTAQLASSVSDIRIFAQAVKVTG